MAKQLHFKECESNKLGKFERPEFRLRQVNFSVRYGYRAKNLAMDKPIFIAKIQFYFFRVPNLYFNFIEKSSGGMLCTFPSL